MQIKHLSLAILATVSMASAQAHNLSSTAPGTVHSTTGAGELATNIYADSGKTVADSDAIEGSYDTYYFTLNGTFDLQASASVNAQYGANSDTYNVTLFGYDPGQAMNAQTPVNMGSFTFGTTSTMYDYGNELAGSYYYTVAGYNPSSGIDQISLQSHITAAVPEPETYAMLLAGLGVIGFVARRRKSS